MAKAAHRADPLTPYLAGEQRAEPVPPMANCFMTDVDAALGQQVLNVA